MAGGSSLGFIQEAIYSILTQDAALMDMITGVFNFVPDNEIYPSFLSPHPPLFFLLAILTHWRRVLFTVCLHGSRET